MIMVQLLKRGGQEAEAVLVLRPLRQANRNPSLSVPLGYEIKTPEGTNHKQPTRPQAAANQQFPYSASAWVIKASSQPPAQGSAPILLRLQSVFAQTSSSHAYRSQLVS